MVESGPPQLRITESVWLRQKSQPHIEATQRSKMCGLFEPNDSWYWGLALRYGIRSKAITVDAIRIFKTCWTNFGWQYDSKKRKFGFQLSSAKLNFLALPAQTTGGLLVYITGTCKICTFTGYIRSLGKLRII